MTRRDALVTLAAATGALAVTRSVELLARQVDPRFLKMYEEAQRQRPAAIGSVARIAPIDEPGIPLTVKGQLFDREGARPLSGVIVFGYHTDREGNYNRPGVDAWRLQGWARSDDNGRFEFGTIRPAPYPQRNAPAHIHMHVDGPTVPRQWIDDVLFAGDPLLSADARTRAERAGRFSNICAVIEDHGRQRCEIAYRVTGEHVF
jgi:protocatechuate 3,4-dioxygenase beta subunit